MKLLDVIIEINKALLDSPDSTLGLDRATELLGRGLNVDVIEINKNTLDEETEKIYMENLYQWRRSSDIDYSDKEVLSSYTYEELYDTFSKTLAIGKPLYGNYEVFPVDDCETAKHYSNIGLKGFFTAPIFFNSTHWGNISLLDFSNKRNWEELEREIMIVAGIFGAFLKNSELRELFSHELCTSQSAKMATLGEMAAGIAHEINNPLFVINGYATKIESLIERESLDVSELQNISKMIQRHCKRVTSIISGLRLISRKSKLDELEVKNFKDVIESTLDISKERIRLADIRFFSTLEESMDIPVECHPEQISQVIVNLLNNSYDSVVCQRGEKWIEVDLKELDDRVIFSLTDSGKRVTPEVEKKMMQPFYTTKESGKGTGLGLSISKEIINKHGGKFYLDHHCENMRFIVELPKINYE